MDSEMMRDLVSRIKTEPSVLFLGQNYIGSMSGSNLFYEAINERLCNGIMPAEPSYYNIRCSNTGTLMTLKNILLE